MHSMPHRPFGGALSVIKVSLRASGALGCYARPMFVMEGLATGFLGVARSRGSRKWHEASTPCDEKVGKENVGAQNDVFQRKPMRARLSVTATRCVISKLVHVKGPVDRLGV